MIIQNEFKDIFNLVNSDDYPIIYNNKFREFGISILDGGSSYLKIQYCPITGKKLPKSLRDEWFDELEKLGLEPSDSEKIPKEFLDDNWWISRNI